MDFLNLSDYPIDLIIIALVLFAGIFQKKYLFNINISPAWKTLIVSAAFTIVYAILIKVGGKYTSDLPVKWFFSYVTGTSLYELLMKKLFAKLFPEEKEEDDNNNTPVIKMVLLFAFLIPITSCNMLNKHKTSTAYAATYHNDAKVDSTYYFNGSVGIQMGYDSILKKVRKIYEEKSLQIDFANDSSGQDKPIIVEHTTGKLIINPGGRKVASINLQSDSSSAITDSARVLSERIVFGKKVDSIIFSKNAASDSTISLEETNMLKSFKRLAILPLIIVLLLTILFGYAMYKLHRDNELIKEKIGS